MKSSIKILLVFAVIFAMVIGIFIGLSSKIGTVSDSDVSGTMAKINNYQKAQSSITGSEIANQLLSDTVRLKNMQNYMRYYYATSVKMSGDMDFLISEANANENFKNKYTQEISEFVSYKESFEPARINMLIALRACLNPTKTDPQLLSVFINQASNEIAQINFKNRVILDFIDILDLYIKENKGSNVKGLSRAHDLLMYNQVYNGVMTRDKLMVKSFSSKEFYSDIKTQKMVDPDQLAELMKKDIQKLTSFNEQILGTKNSEKLIMDDIDKLVMEDTKKIDLVIPEKSATINWEKLGSVKREAERFN
jgi:hypothetical protein